MKASPAAPLVDPEGTRLPIKLDSTSNGEYVPVPLAPANVAANRLAHEFASVNSKKLGISRRSFLVSSCGAASTLLAFNQAHGRAGMVGGFFEIDKDAALDEQLARAQIGAGEERAGVRRAGPLHRHARRATAKGPDVFIKDVFMDSDTDLMVLSFVPSTREAEPVTIQAADAVRRIVDKLEGTHRLLLHGRVNPNQPGDLEGMDELAQKWGVSAWKTYTQYGPGGKGYFLSDDVGIRFIEKARALGVKVICIHKGLPFGRQSYEHSQCSDIGVVAKRFPDVKFLIYHSGYVTSVTRRTVRQGRRHRHADHVTAEERRQAEQQRLRRARLDLAPPDARPRAGGARAGQADPALRRGQRAVGHRLDLVRLAAGPDRGVPHLPDLAGVPRALRLRGNHAGAAREGVRTERCEGLRHQRGGSEESMSPAIRCRWKKWSTRRTPSRTSSPTGRRRGATSSG